MIQMGPRGAGMSMPVNCRADKVAKYTTPRDAWGNARS